MNFHRFHPSSAIGPAEAFETMSVIHRLNQRCHLLLCARLFTLILPHCPEGITMQRSLTAADVSFVSLQSAIFCVQCELLSDNNTPQCLACGSAAVLSLSRVLGGSLRGQQTARLIADAELDLLVRSLLYTVPQVAEAGQDQDAYRIGENQFEFPAAATFSTHHRMRPRHHGPVPAPHPPIDAGELDLEPGISIIAEKAQTLTGATGAAIALRSGNEIICRARTGAPPRISGFACKPIADSRRNACAPAKCYFAMTRSRTREWIGRVAGGWACARSWSLRCATSGGRWEFSRCCRRRPTRSTTTM